MAHKTTGGPIAMHIVNRDFDKMERSRYNAHYNSATGHADLTGAIKYGYGELRLVLTRVGA